MDDRVTRIVGQLYLISPENVTTTASNYMKATQSSMLDVACCVYLACQFQEERTTLSAVAEIADVSENVFWEHLCQIATLTNFRQEISISEMARGYNFSASMITIAERLELCIRTDFKRSIHSWSTLHTAAALFLCSSRIFRNKLSEKQIIQEYFLPKNQFKAQLALFENKAKAPKTIAFLKRYKEKFQHMPRDDSIAGVSIEYAPLDDDSMVCFLNSDFLNTRCIEN